MHSRLVCARAPVQTRVATRLSLLLEEREAQLSRSAQGGHTSPGKPDRGKKTQQSRVFRLCEWALVCVTHTRTAESGAVGGDDSSSLMSFLFLRDSEAEGVFGCLQSLLSESQQLLTLLQLKLRCVGGWVCMPALCVVRVCLYAHWRMSPLHAHHSSSSERDGDASALAQVVNYTSRRGVPPGL